MAQSGLKTLFSYSFTFAESRLQKAFLFLDIFETKSVEIIHENHYT